VTAKPQSNQRVPGIKIRVSKLDIHCLYLRSVSLFLLPIETIGLLNGFGTITWKTGKSRYRPVRKMIKLCKHNGFQTWYDFVK